MNVENRITFVRRVASCVALLLAIPASAVAATVTIVNVNGAGVGFNDASVPPATAGCNAGETLGQCRLRVFNQAAAQWGALLVSNITVSVNGQMTGLTCSGTSAVLGSAGPTTAHSNFANAPRPNTSYVQALANSISGTDNSASNDLNANFNLSLDNGTCLTGTTGWWYGTDPSVPVPADRTPLLPVVFHEIGHGLGFVSLYDSASGNPTTGTNVPIWGYYLYDNATDKLWKDMTSAERAASAINDPNLVWTGPRTSDWSPAFLGPPVRAIVNAPAGIAGIYEGQTASFGPLITSPTTGDVVLAVDAVAPVNDGCEAPTNASALAGKIALVDRGLCNFTVKVKNAQLAGAIAVLVGNNVATGLPGMGGADATVTIPSLGITQALATAIKANLPGTNVTLGLDTSTLSGTNEGCVRMFAPNPVQTGSSVSHFHSDAFPNLLMEPALNASIFNKIDLTLPLFRDIGWTMNAEDILFLGRFDQSPCQHVQP